MKLLDCEPKDTIDSDEAMTLVVPPAAVWIHASDTVSVSRAEANMEAEIHSTASTPTPPGVREAGAAGESVVKDENGQEISCVVCNDKSSGKHYGQYTCEG